MDSEYFKRQIALWGSDTQEKLAEKRIAIIGCGGLGCQLGILLGSSGVGHIHLVDFDTVSLHNIHRQIAFSLADEGRFKCDCLKETLEERHKDVLVYAYRENFETFIERNINVDLIIDATDNLPTRVAIDTWAKRQQQVWLYASVEEWRGQVCLFEEASFQDIFIVNDRTPGGITPPIVSFIAGLEATFALRYLAGLPVRRDELQYLYFTAGGEIVHQKFHIRKGA